MQKITPHLWFDKEAKEATEFYVSLFSNSKIDSLSVIPDTPSGDCDSISFTLCGQSFMAISAGPYFTLNPAISFSVMFGSEEELQSVWDALAKGGKALMPLDTYPWAEKYGWVQDHFGVSWQLSLDKNQTKEQRIIPSLLFTQDKAGMAAAAITEYVQIFPNSKSDLQVAYEKGDADKEGYLKYGQFTLAGQSFIAMDSGAKHDFVFNEGISFVVSCDTQEEIDHYWAALSFVPEAEQCGWCKDKYGVSWQVVPSAMNKMMTSPDKEKVARVTQAFLQMKKFDIKKLEEVFNS